MQDWLLCNAYSEYPLLCIVSLGDVNYRLVYFKLFSYAMPALIPIENPELFFSLSFSLIFPLLPLRKDISVNYCQSRDVSRRFELQFEAIYIYSHGTAFLGFELKRR